MNFKRILIAAVLSGLSLPSLADEAAAGGIEQKAAVCAACHGPGGGKPILPEYPILAGQYANYLAHSLHEYKDGKRKNPVMNAQAATLSNDDIEALSRYFELQESTLYTPKIPGHKAK